MSNDTDPRYDLLPSPPAFYQLRLWWYELTLKEHKAATLRWRMNNWLEEPVCKCGAPGTGIVEASGFRGDVAPIFWVCDAHRDVPLTTPWMNGVPQIDMPREECSWFGKKIDEPAINDCACGQHVGMTEDQWTDEATARLVGDGWIVGPVEEGPLA